MIPKIIIFIFSILFSLSAYAQNGNYAEQEFKAKLESVSGKNKTIRCDFVQNKKIKKIKKIVESRGLFYYDNTGSMALHYEIPKGDKIIMEGDSFIIITSGKKMRADASSNPMMAQISYMMQACMSGDVSKLGRGWNMTVGKTGGGFEVQLKPSDRRIQKYISSMTMCFRDSDLTLERLRIEETTGGYTEYAFFNKIINDKIDGSLFTAE